MSKSTKIKIFLSFNFLIFFFLLFFLSSCQKLSLDVSDLNDKIEKVIKKNFNKNFSRSVFDSAIVSYGTERKNYDHLDHFFCKYDSTSDSVSINGNIFLSYLPDQPDKKLYIDSIGKKDNNYTFRCYFHNIFYDKNQKQKQHDFYSYINFTMSDVEFKSVNVDFFSDFIEK
ncbi:hypothetical protein JTY60_01675 [symbiont of Argiope bruennichi]|uniref:hypothetical protein n=1 Tax=symbiont of Argiope bruennichi TaxID=2810479 RepID=UPI003DA3AC5F